MDWVTLGFLTDGMDLSVWVEQSSGGALNAAGTMRVTRLGTLVA